MNIIECRLARLVISETQETPTLVVLREKNGERSLTIGIHIVEAIAINRKITDESLPRPMTHDLICVIIEKLGASLKHIVINKLMVNDKNQGTFHALLILEKHNGNRIEIDSRPSDAIALAVREGSPIFVADQILEQDKE